jgi:hypothetical protein
MYQTYVHKMYQMVIKYPKRLEKIPNVRKILQMALKYFNIFNSKGHQNLPKL